MKQLFSYLQDRKAGVKIAAMILAAVLILLVGFKVGQFIHHVI